jgi:hypothetical protein
VRQREIGGRFNDSSVAVETDSKSLHRAQTEGGAKVRAAWRTMQGAGDDLFWGQVGAALIGLCPFASLVIQSVSLHCNSPTIFPHFPQFSRGFSAR